MAAMVDVVNRVLRRLREEQVETVNETDYSLLLGDFLNEIIGEINDATEWQSNDHTVTVEVTSGDNTYDLTGTNRYSVLLFDNASGRPRAWRFDNDTDRYGDWMTFVEPGAFEQLFQQDREIPEAEPTFFTLVSNENDDGLTLKLWPIPSSTNYLRIDFNTPVEDYDPAGNEMFDPDEDDLPYPFRPMYLGTLWMALMERGEEIGQPGGQAEMNYRRALGSAVETEIRNRERAGYYDWARG